MNNTIGFPSQGDIKVPLLREIQKHGGQARPSELYDILADHFNLTSQQRLERYPKSGSLIWSTRIRSLRDHLVQSGDLDGSETGIWRITPKGLEVLDGHTSPEFTVPPPAMPEAVKSLLQIAERTRNILLYGPPGTGKTWLVTQFAKAFTRTDKMEMVTFHQSFAYEEFVEGIKPHNDERGQLLYRMEQGAFRRICQAALENPEEKFLLIIDEINRANIAKVLGELITLIEDDKRLGEENEVQVTLPYSGERFGVPKNLTILGTMNTADRSIALLDLALRRRFTFVEMPPNPQLLSTDVAGINCQTLLTRLNLRVGALLDPDHLIGHSYLMHVETEDDLHFAWYHRIVPLLQEYFYHDGERLQAVIGKAFVAEVTLDAETKAVLGGEYEDLTRYGVKKLEGEAFMKAMREIAG